MKSPVAIPKLFRCRRKVAQPLLLLTLTLAFAVVGALKQQSLAQRQEMDELLKRNEQLVRRSFQLVLIASTQDEFSSTLQELKSTVELENTQHADDQPMTYFPPLFEHQIFVFSHKIVLEND